MGTQGTHGFTIIETMLVLAITGLMVAGVFIGVGTQISVQRYRDAVETFKTVLQNQYGEIASVKNDRGDTWECTETGDTSETGTTVRGQSDCILIGRLLSIEGGSIQTSSVVARPITDPNTELNDITSLRENYILNVATNTQSQTLMEWGAQIAWPTEGSGARNPTTPRSFTMLVVRSPDSGQVYTFNSDVALTTPTPESIRTMIVPGSGADGGQRERILCVNSSGLVANDDLSIVLASFASVPNALETSSNILFEQDSRTTRC